jgi:hypothetical protein
VNPLELAQEFRARRRKDSDCAQGLHVYNHPSPVFRIGGRARKQCACGAVQGIAPRPPRALALARVRRERKGEL